MCLEIRNFKLKENLKVSCAKIQLKLNKLEKNGKKLGLFHAILRFFTSHVFFAES